ncbi:YchJ family protein [Paraglaciecola sp. 2405UD69-4]|uniref:YchJ family protein n=1 Tax=Paraglaciecola sp. 2405UD69-4 TaxID=3391836 RepID=UPI0039C8F317
MVEDNKNCFCCSHIPFKNCCQPIIAGNKKAKNAEALMRSRFTAYVLQNYLYILHTYAEAQRQQLSIKELSLSAEGTCWLSLDVISHRYEAETAQVEFKAFYRVDNHFYVMHELSDFVLENNCWRYTTGEILKSSGEFTPERNSQCLCGSGKKYKKCCAS